MASRHVSGKLLAALFFLTLLTGTIWGQVTASMKGNVKDTSGAIVPEATVTIKNLETGLTRTANTDASGSYSMTALPVGQYEVAAQKSGFKQVVRRGITLVVGQQVVLDMTLEVGAVEQEVTVTGEAPLVNTTLSSTAGLVGEQQVKELPLNGRSFDQLLTLNVGTTNYSSNTNRNAFSVSGKRPDQNRFLINGVDYLGADVVGLWVSPSGTSGQVLGVDAVREFNVQADTYGAEYGKRAGGQISIVTSFGTNQLHGSMFEYLRNSKLDARNFFDDQIGAFKRNQFGGSLGGPLKKDQLFLFGNYEGFRQRLGISSVAVVPNNDARQGRLPIGPNNTVIDVPNLKPGMLRFVDLFWPAPNGRDLGGGNALFVSNPLQKVREDFGVMRFDDNLSVKDSLSGNYLVDDGISSNPAADPLFLGISQLQSKVASLQETRIFSPTLLNVATLGFTRAYAFSVTNATFPVPPDMLFVSGIQPGSIAIGGGIIQGAKTVVQPSGGLASFNARNLYTVADDVHYSKGKHSLNLGVWLQKVQMNDGAPPSSGNGSVSYTTLQTMLQDNPSAFQAVTNVSPMAFRSTETAWYVQDEIKLRQNLTLRLGLRDEMTTGWNEKSGRAANYGYDSNGIILTEPFVGHSALIANNAKALWQPRVGLAWDPTGTGTWAVRAGIGIYNDLQDSLGHRLWNPPYNAVLTKPTGVPMLSYIPIIGGSFPPPACNAERQAANQACSIFSPGGVEPNFHTPTTQQWSLTIERQLSANVMLRLGYVGSESFHMPVTMDMNVPITQVCNNPAGCPSGGTQGAVGRAPQGVTYNPPGPRANPYVSSTFTWFFEGTSSYEAANVTLVKRTSGGASFKVNYTFGKALDLVSANADSTGANESSRIWDRYKIGLNHGIAAFNLQQQFNANFSYDLPFGSGRRWASGTAGVWEKLVGGWQWNGIFTAQSGFPVTALIGRNNSGTGDTRNPDVPDRNPAFRGPLILGRPELWFDPHAFSIPIPGTFGNAGKSVFRGPALTNIDTSLFKKFALSERFNLQFRAEAFNLFNQANFKTPNPSLFSGNNYSTSAGVITATATTSRQLQFALRLSF